MSKFSRLIVALTMAVVPVAAPMTGQAQIGLPGGPGAGGLMNPTLDPTLDRTLDGLPHSLSLDRLTGLSPVQRAQQLVAARLDRLTAVVTRNRDALDMDDHGNPAIRGVLLMTDASAADIAAAQQAGFALLGEEAIDGLDLHLARFAVSAGKGLAGKGLASALRAMRKAAPHAQISADTLYFPSASALPAANGATTRAPTTGTGTGIGIGTGIGAQPKIGMIDGGVARHPALGGAIEQRGFARGAPSASAHGTAVASLIVGRGAVHGAAPDAALLVADVYGTDPAGGTVIAIARALGLMAMRGVPVVTISLVGPPNALLAGAVRAVQARGVMIVAAVGNDGPAAPPAYPASYPGVIAITGVDGRNRALIEAGNSLHLDYSAPGADMMAASLNGKVAPVRGTSFAAPLVAGRLIAFYPAIAPALRNAALKRLDAEAIDLGRKGPDARFGRGLLCGACRTR